MSRRVKSIYAFLICCIVFIVANIQFKFQGNRMMSTISWDIYGYYYYLPAFFYDDPARLTNMEYLENTYNPGGNYQAFRAPNGNYVMKYSCGQAIMYLPAFACGHLVATFFGYPVDGMSLPYQVAINFESLLVGLLGFWMLRRIQRKFFRDEVVAAVLIMVGLASNYFIYVAYANPFQHIYLFTLYCIIILLSIQWHGQPNYFTSVLLGLCCGLAALTRPTEIMTALIPLLWGVSDKNAFRQKVNTLLHHKGMIISWVATAFLVGSIQLVYWKIYAGHWLYFSYGEDQTFSWLKPHVKDVLLSYKKGWLTYTPVMILSLIGFIPLFRRHQTLFPMLFIYMLLFIYLVAAWNIWWYGGSFSMRAMIQSYPLLAFPMASFVEMVSVKRIFVMITAVFVIACIWLNGIMTYQALFSPQGIYDGNRMTGKYYWRVFGKTKIAVTDKKLLETNEELPAKLQPGLVSFYLNNLENGELKTDTRFAFSGKHAFTLNDSIQQTPEIQIPVNREELCWYRVSAKVFATVTEENPLHQAKIVAGIWNGDTLVKEKSYSIYPIIETWKWEDIFIDINGAVTKPYNQLKIHFSNAGGKKTLYIDDIQVAKVPAR